VPIRNGRHFGFSEHPSAANRGDRRKKVANTLIFALSVALGSKQIAASKHGKKSR